MRRGVLLSKAGMCMMLLFLLAGCRSTLRYVEMERVDQGMAGGNMGYLYGPPPQEEASASKKRGVFELDVELPPVADEGEHKALKKDRYVYSEGVDEGNKGYLVGAKADTSIIKESKTQTPPTMRTTYTVEKGDSLSKIARHFYGSPNKWRKIYEANKDKIKDPNKLKVGTVLQIPEKQ